MKQEIRLPKGYELKELEKGVYEIVKSEFKLEVGKDYIDVDGYFLIINRTGERDNSGFDNEGGYYKNDLYCTTPNVWREATEEEVKKRFERHLIERYGENWKDVKVKECVKHGGIFNDNSMSVSIAKTIDTGWEVWNNNHCLYYKGNWAEVLEEIPTIELRGLDKKWQWCAMDDDRIVYIYESKPNKHNAFRWWDDRNGNGLNCKYLDQSQFTELKKLNWKDSLHKIKHV